MFQMASASQETGDGSSKNNEDIRSPPSVMSNQLGLKCLYEPAGDTEFNRPDVDVIAVHGIGSNPDQTWVTQGINWLECKDMLPNAIPKARILRFGYDSIWYGENAVKQRPKVVARALLEALRAERKYCPGRPMIFIGHCFGGLVIQKALLLAGAPNHKMADIFTSTTGVVFMGTPHRGSGPETSNGLLYRVFAAGHNVEASVLKALEKGNDIHLDVVDEFTSLWNGSYRPLIHCFYEQRSTRVGKVIGDASIREFIVDESSGTLDGFENHGLPLDHFQLNKFSSPLDGNFKVVRNVIQEMVEESISSKRILEQNKTVISTELPTAVAQTSYRQLPGLPFVRDPKFVGREDLLQQIKQTLKSHRRVALYGSPGNGKTHVAIEYAYRYCKYHPHAKILWVNARDVEQFKQSYRDIGADLPNSQRSSRKTSALELIRRHFSQETSGQWLMVLDGADKWETFFKHQAALNAQDGTDRAKRRTLMAYLPRSQFGSILVTTDSHWLACELVKQDEQAVLEVPPFNKDDAYTFIRKTVPPTLCDDQGAYQIVNALNGSPITTFTQVAAYIVTLYPKNAKVVPHILRSLAEHAATGMGGGKTSNTLSPAFQMWKMSFEHIRETSLSTTKMLSVLCNFDFQTIPRFLPFILWKDRTYVENSLQTLTKFAMITVSADQKHVSIHRLVQRYTKEWLAQQGESDLTGERALDLLSGRFPAARDLKLEVCEKLYPYAEAALAFRPNTQRSQAYCATLLYNMATYQKRLRRYGVACQLLQDALQLHEKATEKDDARIEKIKSILQKTEHLQRESKAKAASASDAGKEGRQEGETQSKGKLASVAGEEQPHNAEALEKALVHPVHAERPDNQRSANEDLATAKEQGRLRSARQILDQQSRDKVVSLLKKALKDREKLETDGLEGSKLLDDRMTRYQQQGGHSPAVPLREIVLTRYKEFKSDELNTPQQTYNHAFAYERKGDYKRDEQLYIRALKVAKEQSTRKDDPDVLQILCNLATVYEIQANDTKAEETYKEAFECQNEWSDAHHPAPIYFTILRNCAMFTQRHNHFDQAQTLFLLALKGQARCLGNDHPEILQTAGDLALIYQLAGNSELAEKLYGVTLALQAGQLGETRPDTSGTGRMRDKVLIKERSS